MTERYDIIIEGEVTRDGWLVMPDALELPVQVAVTVAGIDWGTNPPVGLAQNFQRDKDTHRISCEIVLSPHVRFESDTLTWPKIVSVAPEGAAPSPDEPVVVRGGKIIGLHLDPNGQAAWADL